MQTETAPPPLLSALKQHFGFTSFRPLQEDIIRDTLAGRDVLALLPTGGGKSLCFQLPAVLRPGLTVVVSPLISLMKDQVDALQATGVPATFLNSSLPPQEQQRRFAEVRAGRYRLLYVAPERLMLGSFLSALQGLNVALIAVDEAHCISEWGHDFRPEYRQLAALRSRFPQTPLLAMTATATERVRKDIIAQLRMNDPSVYVGSFNRTNLTYRVTRKRAGYEQLISFLRERPDASGIVYCQSRRATEYLAERLNEDGLTARPYHAGLSSEERSLHQEMFVKDRVRVVCATIAFGMGIDKPDVRFVVHYDLPKSLENYYQETGRAGRDGLPSDCLLLYSPGDAVKYARFFDEKPPEEREMSQRQLDEMVRFAESDDCRRRLVLAYFGEEYTADSCSACDNCLEPRGTFDATAVARKLLACLQAVRKANGFSVGLAHLVDVLAGRNTEKIRRWRNDRLDVHGSGRELSHAEWTDAGKQLIRLGILHQDPERFNALDITPAGREVLSGQRAVTIRSPQQPEPGSGSRPADSGEFDDRLFQRLRALRKKLAEERNVPPYVIFSDVALRQMSRDYPQDEASLRRISGVGEKKLQDPGPLFLREIAAFLQDNQRREFPANSGTPVATPKPRLNDSQHETLRLFRSDHSVDDIAAQRGLARSTVLGHLAAAAEAGEELDTSRLLDPQAQREIDAAFARLGPANLTGVRELLGHRYDYGLLRLYRALASRRTNGSHSSR
jgi:ATP-dependent DNA helicase RecQ